MRARGARARPLSAGELHTVSSGLSADTYAWGNNADGQLGTGTAGASVASPVQISPSSSTGVRAGARHSCWYYPSQLQCWGRNDDGQLGLGTAGADVATPTSVTGVGLGSNGLGLGAAHTCFINSSRQLFCWGANGAGQLGVGSTMTPISSPMREASMGTSWAGVDAGGAHTCARTTAGALYCWGSDSLGQLGLGSGNDSDVPVQVGTSTGWTAVSAGVAHTCGIRSGQLHCWGDNSSGQLGDGTTMQREAPVRIGMDSDWVEVSAGQSHTCGIRTGGGVYCWGSNASGQLGVAGADALSPQRVCGF